MHIIKCKDTKYGNYWIVEKCPYCGKKHRHTKGEGYRVPHCETKPTPEDYYLEAE